MVAMAQRISLRLLFFVLCVSMTTALEGISSPSPSLKEDVSSDDFHPCGFHDLCRCRHDFADCDATNLTFVPVFHERITSLYFGKNGLMGVETEFFFENVTGLTTLSLSDNGMTYLHPDAFKLLSNLTNLYLDGNNLTYAGLAPALTIPSLEFLSLLQANLQGPMPDYWLVNSTLPRLKKLWIDMNTINVVNMRTFRPLTNLSDLQLDGNEIQKIVPDHLPSLTRLTLNYNKLEAFPVTCHKGRSFYEQLEQLFVIRNYIVNIENSSICLPSLTLLNLNFNFFSNFKTGFFEKLSKLHSLFVGQMNAKIMHVDARAFANPSLSTLHLDVNHINFADSSVSWDAFVGCPKLSKLELEDNNLSDLSDEKFYGLFSPLKSLMTMYMGRTQTKNVTAAKFKAIRGVKYLYLFGNSIESIPDGAFDDFEDLHTLALDRNRITNIGENTFSLTVRNNLRSLNLSNNPLECTCSLMWFRSWVMSHRWMFDFDNAYSHYDCHNLPDTDLAAFYMSEQMCLLSHAAYVFTVVIVGVFVFSLTSATLLFRYRWHIRLQMYEVFRGNPQARWRQRRPEDFQYDLFVSYSGEDVLWVIQHLIPTLERGMGLRLCIHQRDFLLGNNITDNIAESLAVSKRVLLLLSPRFVLSQWCQFELQMCLRHVVENDDVMVIAFLEDVPSRDMTSTLLALLKTTTYIQWGEEPEASASFWGRLRLALNDLLDDSNA